MNEMDFLKELQQTFLVEALELLEQNESCFLGLEQNPSDLSNLERILRLAHNLKGSSKSVGLEAFAAFCHKFENILVAIRKETLKVETSVINLLLKCNDRLKKEIITLQQYPEAVSDFSDVEGDIEAVIKGETPSDNIIPRTKVVPLFDISGGAVEEKRLVEEAFKEEETLPPLQIISPKAPSVDKEEGGKVPASSLEKGVSQDYIRLSLDKIDNLLNAFGEQVILQSTLEYYKSDILSNKENIFKTIGQLSKITYDLQQTAIALRMFSLKSIFTKMERVVRDTSKLLGKKVEFIKNGEDHELDKTILDAISDPLTHMVRNAVDHGLETPRDRLKKGKPEVGTVKLSAYHKGGQFYIEVSDDGHGLDMEKIINKAVSLGIIQPGQELTPNQMNELIFYNGLSTKETASDISGRGVGMDVVKDTITHLKGSCDIQTQKDVGTTFTIRLPLTLAIFKGMICQIGEERFVFANSDIEETAIIDTSLVRRISPKKRIVEIKDEVLPVIDMERELKKGFKKGILEELSQCPVLIVKGRSRRYALAVRELISLQRIVQKNLGPEIKGLPGVAGGTILGDGHVSLILDTGHFIDDFNKAA